jgi:hypothetical protein
LPEVEEGRPKNRAERKYGKGVGNCKAQCLARNTEAYARAIRQQTRKGTKPQII